MRVLVKGAGVAGLAVAHELVSRGLTVEVVETASAIGGGASWLAGGMLAPWCERVSADAQVLDQGRMAADWWEAAVPGEIVRKGTLVVAQPRDMIELARFASRTSGYEWLDEGGVAELEPALSGRFRKGLFFRGEAHLDPRRILQVLQKSLHARGVRFRFGVDQDFATGDFDHVIDCTGSAAIGKLDRLRGVRGEMLHLETGEIALSRPVRLLHPRHPIYVVPRERGRFMVGATMIESDANRPPTARSLMELLNAAYALHPAFGEACVIETGAGVRPAFPDNVPRVVSMGDELHVNGLYRHGFLLAPAMARRVCELLAEPMTRHAMMGAMP
jgi:glycine oxidase